MRDCRDKHLRPRPPAPAQFAEKVSEPEHWFFKPVIYNARVDAICRRSRTGEGRMSMLKRFLRDEAGATAIEYGLIAAGISVAIVLVVKGVGTDLTATLTSVQNGLK
jgi:pilus assembly protein Flp/PilA